MLDALKTKNDLGFRRKRNERVPLGKFISRGPDDDVILNALDVHGPLPTSYLVKFSTKSARTESKLKSVQRRLTKLYHGAQNGSYYLERPREYRAIEDPRSQDAVYDLSSFARSAIGSTMPPRTDQSIHRLMGACVTASIDLALKPTGYTFVPRSKILQDKPLQLSLSSFAARKALVPDELFGIDYGGGEKRYFACEWDRATEPLNRKAMDATDFASKIDAYLEVFNSRTFKEEWGIQWMMVLIATVSERRAQSIREATDDIAPRLSKQFITRAFPEFRTPWQMPPVYDPIFVWQNTQGPFDITK